MKDISAVDYSDELSELLELVSEVAINIRLNSSYNREFRSLSQELHLPDASKKKQQDSLEEKYTRGVL